MRLHLPRWGAFAACCTPSPARNRKLAAEPCAPTGPNRDVRASINVLELRRRPAAPFPSQTADHLVATMQRPSNRANLSGGGRRGGRGPAHQPLRRDASILHILRESTQQCPAHADPEPSTLSLRAGPAGEVDESPSWTTDAVFGCQVRTPSRAAELINLGSAPAELFVARWEVDFRTPGRDRIPCSSQTSHTYPP